MSSQEPRKSLEEAEKAYQLFEAHRLRLAAGEAADFEVLCAENPHIADDLRFLHASHVHGHAALKTMSIHGLLSHWLGEGAVGWLPLEPEDPEEPAPPGETVDPAERYVSRGEVGRGGTSRVLKVWDSNLGRTIAMKVAVDPAARLSRAETPGSASSALERFLGEAHVTARLDHPGIVPVHDLGFDREGRAYFTMRLVKGRELGKIFDLARRGEEGWSIAKAVTILAKVCQTVAFAHAKGVIHRDLKPANVMVGSFGETYVVDWGLARVLSAKDRHAARMGFASGVPLTTVQTRRTGEPSQNPVDPLVTPHGTIVGTPVFMPPEQAAGDVERVNAASDVYSLGAILYTLLAGRAPYVPDDGKASPLDILGRVVEGPPRPILEIESSAPGYLVAVSEKAMARRQEDRYQGCLELAEDLERCIAGRRGPARGPQALTAAGSRHRRRRAAAIELVLTLAFAALLVWFFFGTGTPNQRDEALLADLQRLADLKEEAAGLGPATSQNAAAMRGWLERARSWAGRATGYKAMLESARLSMRGGQDAVLKDLGRLVRGLEALTDPDPSRGEIASVERRLETAMESRKKTIDDVWELWQAAVRSIADRGESPWYGGLDLAPQEGLIPLGPDPRTGLWEFGHLQTGSVPLRGADGSLSIGPESGLVLVLIPGGQDREAFFISRRKMTRQQWRRAGGRMGDPEASGAEAPEERGGPMTLVTWDECVTVLGRLGLTLPTLVEWRRAAAGHRGAAAVPPPRFAGFGLEDLEDPVQEWCLDWAPNGRGRAILGGSPGAGGAGGAGAELAAQEHRGADLGLRPARGIIERVK